MSVNVGYFRNWWGNWYAVDNRSTSLADYTPFSIVAPVDARLPGGGGNVVSGLYNLVPSKVGAVDELAQSSSNFAQMTENWQGVDFNVVARLRNGLTVQGGTSTGRRLQDACAVRSVLPEYGAGPSGGANNSIGGATAGNASSVVNPYCRIVEPYNTEFKGLATYLVPKVGRAGERHLVEHPRNGTRGELHSVNAIAIVARSRSAAIFRRANVTVNLMRAGDALRGSAQRTSTSASRRSSGTAGRGLRSVSTSTTSRTPMWYRPTTRTSPGDLVADADRLFSRRGSSRSAGSSTSDMERPVSISR